MAKAKYNFPLSSKIQKLGHGSAIIDVTSQIQLYRFQSNFSEMWD